LGADSPPRLAVARAGTDLELTWRSRAAAGFVQAASQLADPDWSDLDPQPVIQREGITNRTTLPIGPGQRFFRVRVTAQPPAGPPEASAQGDHGAA